MSGGDILALARQGPVHFMGVAGAGMCPLAELVIRAGGRVTGCDLKEGPAVRRLRDLGATVHRGHDPSHVEDTTAVVVTSAVSPDHPELARARVRGIPVLKRARALADVVNRGTLVAVAGTHGKTTTTAITAEVLAAAGRDPTAVVGGTVPSWNGNLRAGGGDLFVVEADEYDRSFLTLEPDVAVVTNVEADHLEVYGDLQGLREGFRTFLSEVRPGGQAIVCADDPGAARLVPGLAVDVTTYGLSAGSMLRAVDVEIRRGGSRFRVVEAGHDRGTMGLAVPGFHNLRNALGAAAAARRLGASWEEISAGLERYRGVARRFQLLGRAAGVEVIDDYAHHPTEISATLEATREAYPGSRLVAVFQPHLYTRTRDFQVEFGQALARADVAWITDVFPAREAPIEGVTGELVADAARSAGTASAGSDGSGARVDVRYHADLEGLERVIAGDLRPDDVLVIMGAGSVEELGPRLLARLEGGEHA